MIGAGSPARPVWAEIDLAAVEHNIDLIRRRAGRPVRLIVPVKANAYGHGVVEIAAHLERLGVEGVATANVDEAIALRRSGVRLPILMYASHLPAAASLLLEHDLTPTVAERAALDAVAAAASGRAVPVHVEVDAGFGRLGVRFDGAAEYVRAVMAEPRVRLEGLYTHVPFGDDTGAAWAARRIRAFTELVREIEREHRVTIPCAQVAASSAVLASLPDELNTIAPGHLTYGLSPLAGVAAESLGFEPALRAVRAQVIHIGRREPGDDLAGGHAGARQRTAVLLLGIDNGFEAAPGASVLLRGRRCAVLSVTAEYTVVDISHLPDVAVGEIATVIGSDGAERISIAEAASARGRGSGYWMMCLRRIPLVHDPA